MNGWNLSQKTHWITQAIHGIRRDSRKLRAFLFIDPQNGKILPDANKNLKSIEYFVMIIYYRINTSKLGRKLWAGECHSAACSTLRIKQFLTSYHFSGGRLRCSLCWLTWFIRQFFGDFRQEFSPGDSPFPSKVGSFIL
jgi:hypothetical protein